MDSNYDNPATDWSQYYNVELKCYLHQHCVESIQPFPCNPVEELPEVPAEYHTFVTIQSGTQDRKSVV